MPDYAYYTGQYLGDSIPEGDFPLFARRAGEELDLLGRSCRLTAPPGTAPATARDNAVCAVADALYYYDCAASGQGAASSVSVGSVSSSFAQSALPDLTPKAQAAEVLRCVRRYFTVERWCGEC